MRVLNVSSVEQIRHKRGARLKGMVFLVYRGWQDEESRRCCLSVGLVYSSVLILPLRSVVSKETLTSRKGALESRVCDGEFNGWVNVVKIIDEIFLSYPDLQYRS